LPYGKIERTGCCVSKGRVQVRYSLFLHPGEKRYEEYYLEMPIIPEKGYPGELTDDPESQAACQAWHDALPTEMVNTPFHDHFEYFEADATDKEIADELAEVLDEFWAIWQHNENISDGYVSRKPKTDRKEGTPIQAVVAEARVALVKELAKALTKTKNVRGQLKVK